VFGSGVKKMGREAGLEQGPDSTGFYSNASAVPTPAFMFLHAMIKGGGP
jgi:hypothetical protein